ncbi:MAG TPA: HD domain-containing protein [Sulfurimonas sp.]|nr:HD domain-containing protein [Sulfurimonas sp.]
MNTQEKSIGINNEHEAVETLAKSAGYKEHKMGKHSQRIAHYCKLLAKTAGLNEKIQDTAFYASQVYDLGKVGIPDSVLLKAGKLDDRELEVMKTHSRLGYDILKYSKTRYLKAGAVIAYSHHEKYDGSGYPIGLKGETIPILGRIVAIADVFDALTHERVYKKAWSIEEACQFLVEEKGKHFDPSLVEDFIQHIDEVKSIKTEFSDT